MKKIFFGFIALLMSATMLAAPRSVEEAAEIAAQFTNSQPQQSRYHKAPRKAENMRFVHRVAKPNSAEDAFFIFNQADNSGFVIVSADDNAVTILGYSDEGAFDATNIPSNVQFWFDFVAERIADTKAGARRNDMQRVRKATKVAAISPLLGNIKWDQGTPYNNLCPMDKTTRAYTGCVATAAAQIMKMYNWPETGQGSHTDQWKSDAGKQGTSTADFGATTYEWANMLDTYKSGSYTTAQANAVATLMFHVGVACDMQFGGNESNGSGAYTDDMGNALVTYFRYKNTAQYKSGLSNSQLTTLFNTELEAGRPILMGGSNNEGGHEFVCDGRDGNGLFHINWGWGGTSNGHFALNGLDPDQQGAGGSSAGYNQQIDCVIGIEPDKDPVYVTGVTVTPTALTLKIKETQQLTATVSPADASNKGLGWTSSNENIVTVSASGVVKGVATGSATITATTFDGNKTATCTVTVTDEVALPTLLEVDKARAEYDDQYEEPWTIDVYKSNSELVPYVRFWPDGKQTSKIAGTYTFTGQGGYLWNNLSDPDEHILITSGQLVITCLGTDNGTNGCNTYHVLSYFMCEDNSEYKVDATLEICAKDADDTTIDLTDAVGTQPFEVTWMANGEVFAENIAANNKLVLPTDKPGNCENGKEFVGWSKTEIAETDEAPTFAKTGDAVTANATYYAVYATPEEGSSTPSQVASVTFKTATNDGSTDISSSISEKIVDTATGISSFSGSKVYEGKNGAKLGSSGATGSITLTLPAAMTVTKVVVNASQYGSDTGKLTVSAGSTTLGESQSPASNLQFVAASPVEASTVTVATTSKRAYVASISVTAGGGTSYSEFSTSCGAPKPKYAITINPAENGSLATSPANEAAAGRTVTVIATPAQFYQLGTLTVKDASDANVTVSGTGNTRTFVMPEKAVSISATFVEQDKVTVRFFDKGTVISSEEYFIGQTAAKPANPTADCADYTFVGWWTAELAADNTAAKSWVSDFTVTGAKDYYAIYSKTIGGGMALTNNYKKITTTGELATGNYIVVGKYNSNYYAMKNAIKSTYYIDQQAVTPSADVISTTDGNIIWKLTVNDNNLSFYNEAINQYVYMYHPDETHYNLGLTDGTSGINFTYSVSSGSWDFISTAFSGRHLEYYGSKSNFTVYTAAGDAIYLFKQQEESSAITYYSSAVTCSATPIDNTVVGEKAVKVIENGQIVIIRGNEKYTIFGQKIQ